MHGRKSNANNESVAPKKRKSRQDAKEDKQLGLLFRSSLPKIINRSGIQSNQLPKMPRLSGSSREVVAHKSRTTGGLFQEEVRAYHFMEDN